MAGMQDAMGVDTFASSDGAFAAEALFDAYRSGDNEEVRKCTQTHSAFIELDNQVRGPPFCKHSLQPRMSCQTMDCFAKVCRHEFVGVPLGQELYVRL